jgi:ubiquinone/menaquinone biosynthesis C-methylase UbiE
LDTRPGARGLARAVSECRSPPDVTLSATDDGAADLVQLGVKAGIVRNHRWPNRQDPDPTERVENPFRGSAVAARYAAARPDLHRLAIELLAGRLPKPDHALDLGAGTGLSTRALLDFAETVVGIDTSEEMLRRCSESRGYYVLAAAELLPFRDDVFDLATIASALHWFGPEALGEVLRVLRSGGSLVVYDVWFPAEMRGVPEFHEWATGEGLSRYVAAPRYGHDRATLHAAGFKHLWDADLRREVEMTETELVEYLMTHSERIAAVRYGLETEAEQGSTLSEGIAPFFAGAATRGLAFGIDLDVFQKRNI